MASGVPDLATNIDAAGALPCQPPEKPIGFTVGKTVVTTLYLAQKIVSIYIIVTAFCGTSVLTSACT
jgi:hypothetical protein